MKIKKSCGNCIRAVPIPVNDDLLCQKKGIVSPDYVCGRHKLVPGMQLVRQLRNKCINCAYFILSKSSGPEEADGSDGLGFCQILTVRKYNGKEKNACSKFTKKREVI